MCLNSQSEPICVHALIRSPHLKRALVERRSGWLSLGKCEACVLSSHQMVLSRAHGTENYCFSAFFVQFNLSLHSLSNANSICECRCVGMELVQERACQISLQLTQRHGRKQPAWDKPDCLYQSGAQRCSSLFFDRCIDCHVNQLNEHVACEHVQWECGGGGGGGGREGGRLQLVEEQLSSSRQNLPHHSHKAEFVSSFFGSLSVRQSVGSIERRSLSAGFQNTNRLNNHSSPPTENGVEFLLPLRAFFLLCQALGHRLQGPFRKYNVTNALYSLICGDFWFLWGICLWLFCHLRWTVESRVANLDKYWV